MSFVLEWLLLFGYGLGMYALGVWATRRSYTDAVRTFDKEYVSVKRDQNPDDYELIWRKKPQNVSAN